jgi:hypothetical protein
MKKYTFNKGIGNVRVNQKDELISDLKKALKINNPVTWSKWLNGHIDPKLSQCDAIEQVFAKYGITDFLD